MASKMTHEMRAELADVIRLQYRSAESSEKRRILGEFIATTWYHEKSAIRVLNASPAPKRRQTRQRPSIYDEAARAALVVLWEASDRVCGKRLRPLLGQGSRTVRSGSHKSALDLASVLASASSLRVGT